MVNHHFNDEVTASQPSSEATRMHSQTSTVVTSTVDVDTETLGNQLTMRNENINRAESPLLLEDKGTILESLRFLEIQDFPAFQLRHLKGNNTNIFDVHDKENNAINDDDLELDINELRKHYKNYKMSTEENTSKTLGREVEVLGIKQQPHIENKTLDYLPNIAERIKAKATQIQACRNRIKIKGEEYKAIIQEIKILESQVRVQNEEIKALEDQFQAKEDKILQFDTIQPKSEKNSQYKDGKSHESLLQGKNDEIDVIVREINVKVKETTNNRSEVKRLKHQVCLKMGQLKVLQSQLHAEDQLIRTLGTGTQVQAEGQGIHMLGNTLQTNYTQVDATLGNQPLKEYEKIKTLENLSQTGDKEIQFEIQSHI